MKGSALFLFFVAATLCNVERALGFSTLVPANLPIRTRVFKKASLLALRADRDSSDTLYRSEDEMGRRNQEAISPAVRRL